MLLKLTAVVQKTNLPASRLWSGVVAFIHARRQRARDRHTLSRMDDHILRDIGLSHSVYSHSVYNPVDRAR